jgi:hypothetical protein
VVAGSLRRRSIFFDEADLDAHYNIAWQGLYNELLAGTTVENPEGFLVTIMIRRAIDDSRGLGAQRRAATYELSAEQVAGVGRDFDVVAGHETTDSEDGAGTFLARVPSARLVSRRVAPPSAPPPTATLVPILGPTSWAPAFDPELAAWVLCVLRRCGCRDARALPRACS